MASGDGVMLRKVTLFTFSVFGWMCLLIEISGSVNESQSFKCPATCMCQQIPKEIPGIEVDCNEQKLTAIPLDLDDNTVKLDLSRNNITTLPEGAFNNLRRLKSLHLVTNSLPSLTPGVFAGLNHLTYLTLAGNKFKAIPRKALRNLHSLESLYLDHNEIPRVPDNSFRTLRNLQKLRLDENLLTEIPVVALNQARKLQAINLGYNQIETIPDYAFVNLTDLFVLVLSNNKINYISDKAFEGLPVLNLLDLSENQLKHIPEALLSLPDLYQLSINDNHIDYLQDGCFRENKKLSILRLKNNPITTVGKNTFSNMPNLEKLELSEARDMTQFPDLKGTTRLEDIALDRASISVVPSTLCDGMDFLNFLDLHTNKISRIPNMSNCTSLMLLNLGNNVISSLDNGPLKGLDHMKDLILAYNQIGSISENAFEGLQKLQYLDLSYNKIAYIHPNAFASLSHLRDLNLGENRFAVLPTKGLQNLRHLKTFHNKELFEPPSFDALPNILSMALAYAYHCCPFIGQSKETPNLEGAFTFIQEITWLDFENGTGFLSQDNQTYRYPDYNFAIISNETFERIDDDEYYDSTDELSSTYDVENMVRVKPPVDCKPVPGLFVDRACWDYRSGNEGIIRPFLPCDDLFGWWSLRCGVWIVFLLAVLGNGAVLFVSITSRSKMDVTRFLICNLAMSDLCMGVYLGFLAIVDASTLGEFEKYAVRWQSSPGCLVAGFLGVLSSELSVFTLVVITVERFYAITHAMQLDKRVSLRHAGYAMAAGWLICLGIASLPLFEISDYRKFAICLPFETENQASLGYVCFIMIFNAVSFLIIVLCYMGMFISIRGSHTWNTNDTVVAKRMALLVFTDFFCWSPIIFFTLTAAFETNFAKISLDEAKVLTIFVLPLNSCANPFLYAFFTRQFKRDCVKLCKRIEESSMSRHFPSSGVRRPSNGSNRQSLSNTCNVKPNCNHSIEDNGNFGETSNSNSDDSDLQVKRLPLTEEEEQILQYVRSDSGICIDGPKSVPLSEASNEITDKKDLQLIPLLSPPSRMRKSLVKRVKGVKHEEYGPDIILHTKEGHVFLNAKRKSKSIIKEEEPCRLNNTKHRECVDRCAKRLCHHTEKETSAVPNVEINPCDKVIILPKPKTATKSLQADTCNDIIYENSKSTRQKLLKERFEADRSLELGLKVDRFSRELKRNKDNVENNKKCNIATQTDLNVPMRRLNNPGLPADIDKRDRDRHINEWRKTSHLSFLWRNAGSFEAVTQKHKSNSLVELTRPVQDWKGGPSKRHSLTSHHEGYILLKNGSRDSAYEDEELYEFHEGRPIYVPHAKLKSSDGTKVCVVIPESGKGRKSIKRNKYRTDFSVNNEEIGETSILLPVGRTVDTALINKHKHSCDDESGISSSS